MAEQRVNIRNKRRMWVAIMLSLIMPGLGQVYCGRLARGLVLTFLNMLPLPIIMGLLLASNPASVVQQIVGLIIAAGIVQLVAIIDSARLVKRTKMDYELKDYIRRYVYVLLILTITVGSAGSGLYLRDQALEAFVVPVGSMYPTIFQGDRLLANKTAYNNADPVKGDIIVFRNPHNRKENYVKRVVALAGDTVEVRDSELYINGEKLKRELIANSPLATLKPNMQGEVFYEFNGQAKYKIIMVPPKQGEKPASTDFKQITVPKYHCFVLGDNRNHSHDSRAFGPVAIASIKGRFDYLYFPAERWSRFGSLKNR